MLIEELLYGGFAISGRKKLSTEKEAVRDQLK
jgi:hypothetical protein